MASPPDPLLDPLALFRTAVAENNLPIPTISDDASSTPSNSLAQASYLFFNPTTPVAGAQHIPIVLNIPTRFISVASGNRPLDLRSVFFCWLNKDKGVSEYITGTQALNEELRQAGKDEVVTNLVFAEKLDLVTWLAGEVGEEESEFIRSLDANKQTRAEAETAAQLAQGAEDVEMRDAGLSDAAATKREQERLRDIYAAERNMGDRNTVLRGTKVQDFTDVRKKYAPLFFSKSRSNPNGPQAVVPALTSNPALRPPVKAPAPGRRPEPIILLSPSASSLLRMPYIKSFLETGVFTPLDANTPSSGSNILHLTRFLPSLQAPGSKPLRFILVDDPSTFRPDYWDRLVAVFTTGQTWQFKNYKWQQPAELFGKALGVYVGWKGEVVPETVRGWGKGVLTVGIDKRERWRDREVVEDVWRGIEGRMGGMGWNK